mmetsp:Transcript_41400/g.86899  ORF Transcript_41400/g.86899 Transcript_41400/m.86899 type:complete len:135 (-) Transcript_41400:448-852(-)
MAKSIRSKSKRKNRTEFRNTIGTDVAKANMNIVQAKLQECVNSGQMNSFDRLSNLFSGNTNNNTANNDQGEDDEDIVMSNTAIVSTKKSSKLPAKKSKISKHDKLTGMYGDKTSKKVSEKKISTGAYCRGEQQR